MSLQAFLWLTWHRHLHFFHDEEHEGHEDVREGLKPAPTELRVLRGEYFVTGNPEQLKKIRCIKVATKFFSLRFDQRAAEPQPRP